MTDETHDPGWIREDDQGGAIDTLKVREILGGIVKAYPEPVLPGLNIIPEPDGTLNVIARLERTGKLARIGKFRIEECTP
jgi:hypothetical protein